MFDYMVQQTSDSIQSAAAQLLTSGWGATQHGARKVLVTCYTVKASLQQQRHNRPGFYCYVLHLVGIAGQGIPSSQECQNRVNTIGQNGLLTQLSSCSSGATTQCCQQVRAGKAAYAELASLHHVRSA